MRAYLQLYYSIVEDSVTAYSKKATGMVVLIESYCGVEAGTLTKTKNRSEETKFTNLTKLE